MKNNITVIIVYAIWTCALLLLTVKFGAWGFIGGIVITPSLTLKQ